MQILLFFVTPLCVVFYNRYLTIFYMATWKRVLDPVAEPLWIHGVWLIYSRSKERLIFQEGELKEVK
jgi:hypothetical protein